MRAPFCFISALLALGLTAQAGITLDQSTIEIFPKPSDDTVVAEFSFRNTGDKPIRITGLDSTCSCLEATLDKSDYAPGEKGIGKATFKVGAFVGRHEKTLHILTDDPKEPDKVVTAIIDVPEVVSIEPKLLEWVLNTKPEPQSFIIKMQGDDPINITAVSSTRQGITHALIEITPGREYRLIITPQTTEKVTIGAMKITTDSKYQRYRNQMAFFNIVRPELAEKKAKVKAE